MKQKLICWFCFALFCIPLSAQAPFEVDPPELPGNCGPIGVPSAFSPNADGFNDVLYVLGDNFSKMHLIIYNRHGEKVFETKDPLSGWDGYYKGHPQPSEVYFYYLKAECTNGEKIVKKGDITLLN